MVFCNNANLLNVFVRHIANNQLRSLAEVATVAHQLKLLKDDFFASDQQAVAVADRYPQDVFAKVEEELAEVQEGIQQQQPEKLAEELGDLLFATVNLCRHYQTDAEENLRNANIKFETRFRKVEQAVKNSGKSVKDCKLAELDEIWEKIKTVE